MYSFEPFGPGGNRQRCSALEELHSRVCQFSHAASFIFVFVVFVVVVVENQYKPFTFGVEDRGYEGLRPKCETTRSFQGFKAGFLGHLLGYILGSEVDRGGQRSQKNTVLGFGLEDAAFDLDLRVRLDKVAEGHVVYGDEVFAGSPRAALNPAPAVGWANEAVFGRQRAG
ncbi:hypothetical protein CH63R_01228 [Colletotrichum higginsianum IMI 349063]|uniref:Uncharacterized protein n=1 Tax=Colletotrichum higginsianum (strain IMI 349063) TaxID=759273 RepID=A0A1B7YW02_COLHI|nr:hypothetical protein CH63R_01228 [Colletotrichum higginsianum IMI 349063]OBR16048.1 hypothetical protein CH63R_01228 [Colletotrichum higginsianum IMI 349063]